MRDVRVRVTCDIGGKVTPAVDHDLEEGEDFDLPAGWLEVTVRRVVPSAEYEEAAAAVKQRREHAIAAVRTQGVAVDAATLDAEIEAAIPDPAMPTETVDEQTFHVAPDHADTVYRMFGVTS